MGIKEVARQAGVSVATVSYYINGTKNVSPQSSEKIQRAIEETGYRPNLVARGLRTNENKMIAVLVQDITSGYYNDVLEGIAKVLNQHDYGVSLCITWSNPEYELRDFQQMIARQASGVIMTPINSDCDFRALCPRPDFPIVFMDRLQTGTEADVALCDNYAITYRTVGQMIEKGYRRIAYFYSASLDNVSTTKDRLNAYQNALRDRGIEVQRDRIVFSRDPADSYALMEKLYAGKEKPDAIFIASSQMSFGVLRYVQDHRLSVPRDVALVNFDDYEWADITAPTPLTTIRQPANELGRAAAKLMLERIQNPDSAYRTIMLDSQLIERGSL